MSWLDIAYKDIEDSSRSVTLWLLFGFLIVLMVGYTIAHTYLGKPEFMSLVEGLAGLVATILPVFGILLAYKSIVHERTSGSLFLTLGFPNSRKDLVVGTFVGRTVVLLSPTLGALAIAGVLGGYLYGTEGALLYPWFLFATALYGTAFIGIAIGLSMSTTADRWITLGSIGGYALLVLFWNGFHSLTLLILHRFNLSVLSDMPNWALLFRLLKPGESYYRLLRLGFDIGQAERYLGSSAPFYVDWWMAILLLALWCFAPIGLGYLRFKTSDL
jgi:ABC-2 type transport system permease protein